MPSIWCPKCGFDKKRDVKCAKCGFVEKEKNETNLNYQNKKTIINTFEEEEKNKNPIIIIFIAIIAISVGYMAYSKYKENKIIDDTLEVFYGTSDTDKIKEQNRILIEQQNQMMIQANKETEKALKQIDEMGAKAIKSISNIKAPVISYKNPNEEQRKKEQKIQQQKMYQEQYERERAEQQLKRQLQGS